MKTLAVFPIFISVTLTNLEGVLYLRWNDRHLRAYFGTLMSL